jgi:hypothetical protein
LSYRIIVERPAERYLRRRVAPVYAERIRRTIDDLADAPVHPDAESSKDAKAGVFGAVTIASSTR